VREASYIMAWLAAAMLVAAIVALRRVPRKIKFARGIGREARRDRMLRTPSGLMLGALATAALAALVALGALLGA
jgi:hypothetical protein